MLDQRVRPCRDKLARMHLGHDQQHRPRPNDDTTTRANTDTACSHGGGPPTLNAPGNAMLSATPASTNGRTNAPIRSPLPMSAPSPSPGRRRGRARCSAGVAFSIVTGSPLPAPPDHGASDVLPRSPVSSPVAVEDCFAWHPNRRRHRPGAGPFCSALLVLALDLALDVRLGDRVPPVDVPRVHHQADAPSGDEEYRPEEHVDADDRPDHYQERVEQHIDQKVGVEVAPLFQLRDRLVASGLLTCVVDHGGPSPLDQGPAPGAGHARDQGPVQADVRPAPPTPHPCWPSWSRPLSLFLVLAAPRCRPRWPGRPL